MEKGLIYMPELLRYKVRLSYCNRRIGDAVCGIQYLCILLVGFKEEVWEIVQTENQERPIANIETLIKLRLRNTTNKDLNEKMIKEVANEVRYRVLYKAIGLNKKVTVASFYEVFHEVFKEYFHALVK